MQRCEVSTDFAVDFLVRNGFLSISGTDVVRGNPNIQLAQSQKDDVTRILGKIVRWFNKTDLAKSEPRTVPALRASVSQLCSFKRQFHVREAIAQLERAGVCRIEKDAVILQSQNPQGGIQNDEWTIVVDASRRERKRC